MPTTHTLHITLPDNKATRARVVYLQPKAERWHPQSAGMDIVSHDWIEPYWHPASFTFAIGGQTFHGRYMPLRYKMGEDGYTYHGVFELDQQDAQPLPVV